MKTKYLIFAFALISSMFIFQSCTETSAEPEYEFELEAEKSALLSQDCIVEGSLSNSETEALLFMWQEEKMAKDVYTYLYGKYQLRVFDNISKSEAIHQQAVTRLLEAYMVPLPENDQPGIFDNQEIQDLYDNLISIGNESNIGGLTAGAMIEEKDILDLKNNLNETDNPWLTRVFSNLLKASENHLRAFNSVLKFNGAEYSPTFLNDEYFQAIISRTVTDEYRVKGYYAGRD